MTGTENMKADVSSTLHPRARAFSDHQFLRRTQFFLQRNESAQQITFE